MFKGNQINAFYGRQEHSLVNVGNMNFCFYCGKIYLKSYMRTHVGTHIKSKEVEKKDIPPQYLVYSHT